MKLKINKNTIMFMIMWFMCLLPHDVISMFPSYETYFQYLLQAGLGAILLYRYGIKKSKNIFHLILLIWLLLYLPGSFLVSGIEMVTLIKYFCWLIFIWGLLRFFEDGSENEIFWCLKAARPVFLIYMFLTYISMPARATAEGGVFFLGSRATTVQYFICLLAVCVLWDITYLRKLSFFSVFMWVLTWVFAILRGSGQGMMMLFTISALFIFEKMTGKNLIKKIKPIYILVGIVLVNYVMVTLSYLNYDFILNIIQNVLHKDATLTGRSEIFTYSLAILSEHPVFGYGFDNNIVESTLSRIVSAYNTAHNSILQMLINCGYVGTIFFLIANYIGFSKIQKSNNDTLNILYYALIAMFVGGVVSMIIPSNAFFLVWFIAVGRANSRFLDRRAMG